MVTYQGTSWVRLDQHLTGGALRQVEPGWSERKLAAAQRFDQRQAGRERDQQRRQGRQLPARVDRRLGRQARQARRQMRQGEL